MQVEYRYFCGFTADKVPFSLKTRRRNGWNRPESLVSLEEARTALKANEYLGLYLCSDANLLVIDIDDTVPTDDEERIYHACNAAFGYRNYFIERSISGRGLHIIVRTCGTPFSGTGRVFGYRAEFYTQHQAFLLTERTLHGFDTLSIQEFFESAVPVPSYQLEELLDYDFFHHRGSTRHVSCTSLHHGTATPSPSSTVTSSVSAYQKGGARHPHSKARSYPRKRPNRRNALLDVVHLFPNFWRPLVAQYHPKRANPKDLYLTRPGKDARKGHSAVIDTESGLCTNFSTNWTGIPTRQAQTFGKFLAQLVYPNDPDGCTKLAKQFYRYLKTTAETLGIPLPKRSYVNYITIKREAVELITLLSILREQSHKRWTYSEILDALTEKLWYRVSERSLRRHLEKLTQFRLVRKLKSNTKQRVCFTTHAVRHPLLHDNTFWNLDTGFQAIMLQLYTHPKFNQTIQFLIVESLKRFSTQRANNPHFPVHPLKVASKPNRLLLNHAFDLSFFEKNSPKAQYASETICLLFNHAFSSSFFERKENVKQFTAKQFKRIKKQQSIAEDTPPLYDFLQFLPSSKGCPIWVPDGLTVAGFLGLQATQFFLRWGLIDWRPLLELNAVQRPYRAAFTQTLAQMTRMAHMLLADYNAPYAMRSPHGRCFVVVPLKPP